MPENTQYLVAKTENAVLLLVQGRAIYTTCRDFGEFLQQQGKSSTQKLIIDMENCTGIDSTVLGIIAGTASDFLERGAEIILQRCNSRVQEVAENLGLPALLTLLPNGEIDPETTQLLAAGTDNCDVAPATNRTILHAHETLMEINPENVAKFKQVVDFMKSDLGM